MRKLKWLGISGLVLSSIMMAATMAWSSNDDLSAQEDIFGATCYDDTTIGFENVKYCDAFQDILWPFPICGENLPCPNKICPDTFGPEVIGSLNKKVHDQTTNCDLGADYDCIVAVCIIDTDQVFCGSYCKALSGCPA